MYWYQISMLYILNVCSIICQLYLNFYLFFKFLFVLCGLWNLSFLTRGQMYAFSSESMESWPLDHQEIQEIPYISVFLKKKGVFSPLHLALPSPQKTHFFLIKNFFLVFWLPSPNSPIPKPLHFWKLSICSLTLWT